MYTIKYSMVHTAQEGHTPQEGCLPPEQCVGGGARRRARRVSDTPGKRENIPPRLCLAGRGLWQHWRDHSSAPPTPLLSGVHRSISLSIKLSLLHSLHVWYSSNLYGIHSWATGGVFYFDIFSYLICQESLSSTFRVLIIVIICHSNNIYFGETCHTD